MKVKKLLVSQPKPENDQSAYGSLALKFDLNIDFVPFIRIAPVPYGEFRKQKYFNSRPLGCYFDKPSCHGPLFQVVRRTKNRAKSGPEVLLRYSPDSKLSSKVHHTEKKKSIYGWKDEL